MPVLTLHVVSIDAAPVAQGTGRAFDATGGSIGRDETNFLALPDKHRRVSRLHATISFPGGLPTITNSSTSLPLSVGEQQLDGGESMPLAQGALIEIGPYILQAQIGGAVPAASEAAPRAAFRQDTTPTMLPVSATAAASYGQSLPATTAPPFAAVMAPSPGPIGAGGLLPDSFGSDLSAFFSPSPVAAPTAPAPMVSAPAKSIAQTGSGADPFADLLAGIGGSPAPGAASQASLFVAAAAPPEIPRVAAQQSQSGISADPLAAFGGASFAPADSYFGRSPTQDGVIGEPSRGVPADEFNAFQMPSGANRNAADPLAGLLGTSSASGSTGSNGAPSIDSLFQSSGSGGAGSSDASLFGALGSGGHGDGTLEHLIRSDGATDPMALFDTVDELSVVPEPVLQPMRDDRVEVGSAFSPPLAKPLTGTESPILPADFGEWGSPAISHAGPSMAAVFPAAQASLASSPVVPPAPQPSAAPFAAPIAASAPLTGATPVAPANTLTDAFLLGAGLTSSALPHGLTPEIMTVIGSLLRSATAGAVDMLAARAATKREVQASVTIISVQANNPLKFLPNADSALLQLLGKKMPGFMRADVAMRDAFDDLRAHEVGVIAGTRAALTEVLGKFDPAVLGDKLARGSVIDSLMPSARKAKLWDLYLERYLQIRREAEDDFQSIFGRAFVQAYERETARIKGESPMAGGE